MPTKGSVEPLACGVWGLLPGEDQSQGDIGLQTGCTLLPLSQQDVARFYRLFTQH